MDPFLQVRQYMESYEMIRPGDHVLVGLSGGADSVCLLQFLANLSGEIPFTLEAVHVHHGIRGEEADRDAVFAEELCRRLQVPFVLCREDVPALAREWKVSMEEAGRRVRYEIFRRMCGEGENRRIAVAHHMDDQAETVLLNLSRGTGIRGMGAMEPVSGNLIRPLLCLRRREIEEWLRERGESWCEDGSNRQDVYARNRIRHRILPELEESVNARVVEHLAEAARQARQLDRWLQDRAEAWIASHVAEDSTPAGGVRSLEVAEAADLPDPLLIRVLHILMGEAAGSARDLNSRHLEAMASLVKDDRGGILDLPCGLRAVRRGGRLALGAAGALELGEAERMLMAEPDPVGVSLPIPGRWRLGELEVKLATFPRGQEKIPQKEYTKWFDYDKIKGTVCIRTRRPEDRLAMSGVGHKTLRRYMIDSHIPEAVRDRVPVLADELAPLWVIGGRMSAEHQVTEETAVVLAVTISKGGVGNE